MSPSPPPRTTVCSHLDVEHRPGENLVWAAEAREPEIVMTPRFAVPLARSPWPSRYRGHEVQCFGVWWSPGEPKERWRERNAQAIVHFPRQTDEELAALSEAEVDAAYNQFVIELRTADPRVSVVVAAIPPGETLRSTLADALSRWQDDDTNPRAHFSADEGLTVPVVDVACAPALRFHLDAGDGAAPLPSPSFGLMSPRRRFGCVAGFLVAVVDRERRLPLFALWVENTEVLVTAPGDQS